MGIGDTTGTVYEFMGFCADLAPPGGLSFAPVVRYVQFSPESAFGRKRGFRFSSSICVLYFFLLTDVSRTGSFREK